MIPTLGVRALQFAQTVAAGCLVVGFALFSSPNSHAQTLSGINGTITDQSGSAIPDAKITILNIDTGVRRNTESSSAGSYYVTDLIPGIYTVTVEKPGFKSSVQKNVVVQAGMQSTANATLMVGDVSSISRSNRSGDFTPDRTAADQHYHPT